jgi:hypothetical protein
MRVHVHARETGIKVGFLKLGKDIVRNSVFI